MHIKWLEILKCQGNGGGQQQVLTLKPPSQINPQVLMAVQTNRACTGEGDTYAPAARRCSNVFSRSSLRLFIFISSVTDEQHNGSGFLGCHEPRNTLMKNKCIYRETSKQPKTSQSNVPAMGMSAFISSPLHGLQADHAAEREKYFK